MLSIFRTNQFFANILLLVYASILRLSLFIVPSDWQVKNAGILSEFVYSGIGVTGVLPSIFAILLVTIQATMINFMVTEYRMSSEVSLFPGLFYVMITSLIPDFLYLSPVLMGNTFLIIALFQIMETYKQHNAAGMIYNAGFCLGLASFFYFSFSIYIILGWIGLNILRAFKIRERLMLLTGFVAPYILAFTYYYWNDQTSYFYKKQFQDTIGFFDFVPNIGWELYLKLGLMALLLLISLLSIRTYSLKKNIRVQININILYATLLVGFFSLFVQASIDIEHLLLLAIPLGIFISFNFTKMSSAAAEGVHLLLMVLLLMWQFFPIIPI